MSIDRPTRFVVAWALGRRGEELVTKVIQTTRARTAGRIGVQWVGDGWPSSAEIIAETSRDPIASGIRDWEVLRLAAGMRLTQAIKRRKGRRLIRVDVQATIGPRKHHIAGR